MQMQFHADALHILKGTPCMTAVMSCASLLSGKHLFKALRAKSFPFGALIAAGFSTHAYSCRLLVKKLTSSY